jgi:uncharacterized protein YqiB (DUF1249 family)
MLADFGSISTAAHIVKPKTFSGLMDIYEQNYIRLKKIIPDLNIADEMISVSPGHHDLFLSVSQRCKFTTMLSLTYRFQDGDKIVCQPDMHIRIYHDARIAEVHDRLDRTQRRIYSGNSLQQKWHLNRFLYKWLGYCIYQGHYFHPVSNLKQFIKLK